MSDDQPRWPADNTAGGRRSAEPVDITPGGRRSAEPLPGQPPLRRRAQHRRQGYSPDGSAERLPPNNFRVAISLLFVALLLAGGVWYRLKSPGGYALELNGKPLVLLTTRGQAEQALRDLQRKYAPEAPEAVHFKEGELSIKLVHYTALPALEVDAAVRKLQSRVTAQISGFALNVDGTPLVVLPTQAQAFQALTLMQQRGLQGKSGVATFKQRLTIVPKILTKTHKNDIPLTTPEKAARLLVYPPEKSSHVVSNGDSLGKIANENHTTVAELQALNPGRHRLLHKGDIIRLPDKLSPVTVIIRPAEE